MLFEKMDKQKEQINGSSNRALVTRHDDSSTSLRVLNLLDEKQLANAAVSTEELMGFEIDDNDRREAFKFIFIREHR